MKSFINKSVMALILSVGLAGASNQALAGQVFQKVSYDDLNLDRPGDVSVLYGRIQKAARSVCRDRSEFWSYHKKDVDACVIRSVDIAVKRVDNTKLTALHRGQGKEIAQQ